MGIKGALKNLKAKILPTDTMLENDANQALKKERRTEPIYNFGVAEVVSLIVVIITFVSVTLTMNILFGFVAAVFVLLLSMIRNDPEYHNILLYWFGKPLGKGHISGLYLFPWFLGVRRQMFDLHHLCHKIDKEDCFAKSIGDKRVKMTYGRVVIWFGVCPIEEMGFWRNMFAFFIRGFKNAVNLIHFAQMEDMGMTFENLGALALSSITTVIQQYTWLELKGGVDDQGTSYNAMPMKDIQDKVRDTMNAQAGLFGMKVHGITIGDLDVHEDMAKDLEQVTKQDIRGKGTAAFIGPVAKAVKEIMPEGADVMPVVIKMYTISTMENVDPDKQIAQVLRAITGGKISNVVDAMTPQA